MCSSNFNRNLLISMVAGPLLLGVLGCGRTPSESPKRTERGPEEKFAVIVTAVKRDLEGMSSLPAIGFGSRSNELTTQNTQRTVQEELIEPTDETETYRGRITIESKTTYSSSTRPTGDDQSEEGDDTAKGPTLTPLDETVDTDPLLAPLDSVNGLSGGLPSKPRPQHSPEGSADSMVVRGFDNEWTKTYDLAYEGGQWVLKTEIEDEGIRAVFEAALQKQ